jgi:hypothetical protein
MKKIIGIFIFLLLIATTIPVMSINETKAESNSVNNNQTGGIWFVKGIFKYLDEDEKYFYIKAISAKLRGFGNGVSVYRLFFCPIKILKPFHGFLSDGPTPLPGIGICTEWDYMET